MTNISYIPDNIKVRIDQVYLTVSLLKDEINFNNSVSYEENIYFKFQDEFRDFLQENGFTIPDGLGTNYYNNKIFTYKPRHGYITVVLYPDECPIAYIYDFFIYFRKQYNLSSIHNLIQVELSYDLYPINNDYEICDNITNFLIKYIDLNKNFTYFVEHRKKDKFKYNRDNSINGKVLYYIYKDKNANCCIEPDVSPHSTFFKLYPKNIDGRWFVRIEVVFKRHDMSKFDKAYDSKKFDNLHKFFDFVKKKPFEEIFCFSTIDYQKFIDRVYSYNFKERIYKFKRPKGYYIDKFNELNSLSLSTISAINNFYKIKKISKIMNLSSINNKVAIFKETLSLNFINQDIAKLDHFS